MIQNSSQTATNSPKINEEKSSFLSKIPKKIAQLIERITSIALKIISSIKELFSKKRKGVDLSSKQEKGSKGKKVYSNKYQTAAKSINPLKNTLQQAAESIQTQDRFSTETSVIKG